MINVKVESKKNESTSNLLRKFSKRVQRSGILYKAKELQFRQRELSDNKKKQNALHKIRRRREIERDIKLGKISPRRRY